MLLKDVINDAVSPVTFVPQNAQANSVAYAIS